MLQQSLVQRMSFRVRDAVHWSDRTERTQPFIVHLRFVQMQRAHRQPCGRCVSQHAAQLVRSVMHTLLYCQGRELPRPPNILRSKFERSDSATHSELEVIIV